MSQRDGMSRVLPIPALRTLTAILSVGMLFGPVRLAAQPASEAGALPPHHVLAREIFRELIEINTTGKNGCTPAAVAMKARLKAAGFAEADLVLAGPRPQNQNLVARLRGRGTQRPVLFIGHLDVVEALRADWTSDPFVLLEKDGYFYGRGTTDMKDCDTALVTALIRLKQAGYVGERDIIVALTDHEEGGDFNGVSWLVQNRRELIDAEFCINPDGGSGELKHGKPIVMEFQTAEKTYLAFQLEVTNKGGHGSVPPKDNAIYHLAAGLGRLAAYEWPIVLNETTRTFFARSALTETNEATKADLLAVSHTPTDLAAAERLAASSPFYNAMLRTTCVATMLSGGHAENALPQLARAVLNARVLPGESLDAVQATLRTVLADDQIKITRLDKSLGSPVSPLRADVVEKVERLTARMWPGVVVTPTMSTGASDSIYLRQIMPAYGVSGTFTDIDDMRAHGRDERIGVKEFYAAIDFMPELMKALTQ